MLTCFFPSLEFSCRCYGLFFSIKKHKLRTTEETTHPSLLLFFHWCVSIPILMRRVYINPDFFQFGTPILLRPAKHCPFGYRFVSFRFLVFSNCSFKKNIVPVQLFCSEQYPSFVTVLVRTTSSTVSCNCSFENNCSSCSLELHRVVLFCHIFSSR